MKKLISILILLAAFNLTKAQPFTNITNGESGLSVRTNLNNMINYMNALGLQLQFSSDQTNWHYPWAVGDKYIRYSGNFGVSWSPSYGLEQDVTANLTANYIPFFDGTTLENSAMYLNVDKIGIGTTSPGTQLDVNGNIRVRQPGTTAGVNILGIDSSGYITTNISSAGAPDSSWVAITVSDTLNVLSQTITSISTGTSQNTSLVTKGYVDEAITAGGGYTDSDAQDAVGGILDNGTLGDVVFTYTPGTPSIHADVEDNSHNHTIANVTALQDTLNTKQKIITGAASTVTTTDLAANSALISTAGGKIAVSSTVSATELGYLDGVTSAIQTQLNGKGSIPGGSGTEIQYRSGTSTFGAVTGSSVSGGSITLGSRMNITTNTTDYGQVITNSNAGGLGLAILAGTSGTILTANSSGGDHRLEVLSNGQIYMPAIGTETTGNVIFYNTTTGRLTYGTAPSGGGSIWTDAGTYAHLNGYEDIYMPRGKSLSWRSTTADVTGTNTFRITPVDASQLRIYAGAGDHEAVNIYNANAAKLTAFSVKGNLGADLGASATYETDSYSLLNLSANGSNKFVVTGAGTFASAEQASSPGTIGSGFGYWYNKTDGKPYFKNDEGTEYDLSASGGGDSGWTDRGGLIALSDTTDRVIIGGPDNAIKYEALYIITPKNHGLKSISTDSFGEGIIGEATATAGTGVMGNGHTFGVQGNTTGTTGRNYGGYFVATSGADGVGTYISATKAHFELNLNITAPSSSSASGTKGDIIVTTDYIYVCTATNTWKRIALSTW